MLQDATVDLDYNTEHVLVLNQRTILEECCAVPGSCGQRSWYEVSGKVLSARQGCCAEFVIAFPKPSVLIAGMRSRK